MSDSTTDTSAIDEKKTESTNVNGDYVTNMKSFISYVIMIFIILVIYFTSSSLILYGCKLAQSNILPASNCYPYTEDKPDIKPIDINIFTSTIENDMGEKEQKSMKMKFPYDTYNSTDKFLDMLREQKNNSTSFLLNYFIVIIESLAQFNYSAYNSVFNTLNSLPEILIILFGPIIFGIVSTIVLLCDNIYLIYLWFANMGWFFKSSTNTLRSGKPEWTDTTIISPINYCIAVWLVIIFAIVFIFTMPIFFFLSFLLMNWLIITSLFFKAEMNGKKIGVGTIITDVFKFYKVLITAIFSLFIVSAAFAKLGTVSGIVSILTLCLIYFGIISIGTFNPIKENNLTPLVSFEQAKKTCKGGTGSAFGAVKNFFKGGSNIKKDLMKLNNKLNKNN